MVAKQSFQTLRGLALRRSPALVAMLVLVAFDPRSHAQQEPEDTPILAALVDLRSGDAALRAPSSSAFADALGTHGRLQLIGDPDLSSLLTRQPYSPIAAQGQATLSAAILAYGALDCGTATKRAEQAILDLAAAMASGSDTKAALHKAYLYRFLCADRAGKVDAAMAAAAMLARFGKGQRPKELSEASWNKYPLLDAQSNRRKVPVSFSSQPAGATIWIDHLPLGTTPSTELLDEGPHILALGYEDRSISQRITVTGKGAVSHSLPIREQKWKGIAASIRELGQAASPQRSQAMGHLLAATLAEAAFVMREPGRIAVWILPPSRRRAELVGHAPNAQIAGTLALQALQESYLAPGLDANMPLLREADGMTTRASGTKRWWVYGIVLGAAALGAGFIVVQDLSEDRQRIEVTLP